MPPRKKNRGRFFARMPADWVSAIQKLAQDNDVQPTRMFRTLLSEAMTARGVVHSPDDYGQFKKRWRVTKAERAEWLKKRQAEYIRRYRAKQKAKKLQAIADAANSITWTFHPSGQITTSDLDVLATFVGHVDERGRFTPENTRHSVSDARAKAREALNAGLLSGERWHLFTSQG